MAIEEKDWLTTHKMTGDATVQIMYGDTLQSVECDGLILCVAQRADVSDKRAMRVVIGEVFEGELVRPFVGNGAVLVASVLQSFIKQLDADGLLYALPHAERALEEITALRKKAFELDKATVPEGRSA